MKSKLGCGRIRAVTIGGLASALLPLSPGYAQTPDYRAFEQAAYLKFLNANGRDMRRSPALGISFGDRIHRAILDTGSTGVVVAATSIPNVDQLPKIADGELTYTSSGRVMRGRWVRTAFTIVGADEISAQTEPMPVLAVDRVDCLPRARDCDPDEDISRIAMIGVGFAREGDRQSQSTPDKNPFLHIISHDAAQKHGYVLTAHGVHIGLSSSNAAGPFVYVKLNRNRDGTDWSPVPRCISINGRMPPGCGTLLIDTGVGAAFMTLPESQTAGTELQQGDQVSVDVLGNNGAQPLYTFGVGDGSPLTPEKIHLRVAPDRVFLNTSFHILNGFDFLYDADGGYAGFRRRQISQ